MKQRFMQQEKVELLHVSKSWVQKEGRNYPLMEMVEILYETDTITEMKKKFYAIPKTEKEIDLFDKVWERHMDYLQEAGILEEMQMNHYFRKSYDENGFYDRGGARMTQTLVERANMKFRIGDVVIYMGEKYEIVYAFVENKKVWYDIVDDTNLITVQEDDLRYE